MEYCEATKTDWLKVCRADGQFMPDAFPSNDPRMDPTFETWPSLDELPEAVRMRPEIFFNQRPGTNQHEATVEVMGSVIQDLQKEPGTTG